MEVTVTPVTPLMDVTEILIDRKFGALPVIENNLLVGIITEIDLLRALYEMLDE